jgi:hypothetical protein
MMMDVMSHCARHAHFSYCCARVRRYVEEPGTAPCGPGDRAGDGGEARIGRALPVEAIGRDRDGMALSLIVPDQHRAGFEMAPG